MEKVLVTGATGFVGANLVRRLANLNYEITILHRENSNLWRLEDVLDKINCEIVDLNEVDKLREIVNKVNPKKIIHLAIYGGLPYQKDEEKIIETNFNGTINLLNALEDIEYDCFINTGSSSEYGTKNKAMNENDICEPINVYGIAKLAATNYCNFVAKTKNRNIGTLRLFSPFGDFEEQGRLIPHVIKNILLNEDVTMANPKAVRDFIYIDDVIDLYIEILNKPEKIKGEVFNVALGEQKSVGFIAENVKRISKNSTSELKFGVVQGRDSDTNIWVADMNKTKQTFDWEPKYTVEQGLEKSIEWFKKNLKNYL